MTRSAAPLPILLLAACTTLPAPPDTGGPCTAEPLTGLIGAPADERLGAEALRLSGARALRWIRPGDMVTMDYRTDRLNVKLGADGRVESFSCG